MYELMLLGIQYCSEEKKYLYALELEKQKIIRIVKFAEEKSLSSIWKRGKVTKVETISEWPKEQNTYMTHGDILSECSSTLCLRILLNKAASPEVSLFDSNAGNYGIVRIGNLIRVEDGGQLVYAKIWAWKDEIIKLKTTCRSWVSFNQSSNEAGIAAMKCVFGSNRRKIFALIQTGTDMPEIVDFYVV